MEQGNFKCKIGNAHTITNTLTAHRTDGSMKYLNREETGRHIKVTPSFIYTRSNRSSSITLVHAATKSITNLPLASSAA